LFEEAIRHVQDSYVLHRHRRHAASIASSLKSVEAALKSLLMMDASATLIPDLFQTHRVFQAIILEYDVFKTTHLAMIEAFDSDLRRRIIDIERLHPARPSAKSTGVADSANAEYPFFEAASPSGASSSAVTTRVQTPGSYFRRADSARHLRTARRLLTALQAIYPDIADWGHTV
jgi:hypothetical protein